MHATLTTPGPSMEKAEKRRETFERAAKRHPLYEIRDQANALERDIIGSKIGDAEALLSNVLTLTMLVRGLIAVSLAEVEQKA